MKRVIHSHQTIFAMAIINPQLCKQSSIQIEIEQRNEGSIPHLHVFLDKTRSPKNCAYVRLDRPEYLPNHNSKRLNGTQLHEFLQIMTAIWSKQFIVSDSGEIRNATGYEASVTIWEDTYGYCDKFNRGNDGNLIMPDYTSLND